MREHGLADARDVLDQQVTPCQQAREAQAQLLPLAEYDPVQLREHRADLRLGFAHAGSSARTRAACAASWPVSRRSSARRCVSLATTSGGALAANFSSESFVCSLWMS